MRRIVCQQCAKTHHARGLHPEDAAQGFQKRITLLRVQKPAEHAITVIADGESRTEVLPSILCDDCGNQLPDGTLATAVSMWRGGDMEEWEHEYGQIITEET